MTTSRKTDHPLYTTWNSMKYRCGDPTNPSYGGRGIKVCERWLGPNGFWNFVADMGPKPSPKHSIERVDVNGNYDPPPATKWALPCEQSRNTRRTVRITVGDRTQCVTEWARELGIDVSVITQRLVNEWTAAEALEMAPPPKRGEARARLLRALREPRRPWPRHWHVPEAAPRFVRPGPARGDLRRRVLKALDQLGDGPVTAAQVARVAGVTNARARDALEGLRQVKSRPVRKLSHGFWQRNTTPTTPTTEAAA